MAALPPSGDVGLDVSLVTSVETDDCGVLPVRLQSVTLNTSLESTASAHLSPDQSLLAVIDTRGNVRLHGVNGDHPLHGAVFPAVSSATWVKLEPEVERKRQSWHGSDVGPAALIAVDAASSTLFVASQLPLDDAHKENSSTSAAVLCELRDSSGPNNSSYLKNEVPKGRLRQILKKRGHALPCDSIVLVRGSLQGAVLVVDQSVAVTVSFSHCLRRVLLVDISVIDQTPLWLSTTPALGGGVASYAMTRSFWCKLHDNGVIFVFANGGGRCIAVVHLAQYIDQIETRFVALEVTSDGQFCAVSDEHGGISVVNLEVYFADHPEHRERFWRDSDLPVLVPDGADGSAAVNAATDEPTASAADADEDDDDDDEDDGDDDDNDDDEREKEEEKRAAQPKKAPRIRNPLRRTRSVVSAVFHSDASDVSERCWARERALHRTIMASTARPNKNRVAVTRRFWFEDCIPGNTAHGATAASVRIHSRSSSSGLAVGPDKTGGPRPQPFHAVDTVIRISAPASGSDGDNEVDTPPSTLLGFTLTSAAAFASYADSTGRVLLKVCTLENSEMVEWDFAERALPIVCERENPALHLTATSLVACLVGTTRRDLMDELILLDQGQLARQLSMLNGWDQQTLNSHQLENALRYRQLDNVEAVLDTIPTDQVESSTEILLATIEDASKLSKGIHFAQRLLFLATKHVMSAIRLRREEHGVAADIAPLTKLLARLRQSLLRSKKPLGSRAAPSLYGIIHDIAPGGESALDTSIGPVREGSAAVDAAELEPSADAEAPYPREVSNQFVLWEALDDAAVVKDALVNHNLSALQCYLLDRARPEREAADTDPATDRTASRKFSGSFAEIRREAMVLVYTAVSNDNITEALQILSAVDIDARKAIVECYTGVTDQRMRTFLAALPLMRNAEADSEQHTHDLVEYMAALDAAYPTADASRRSKDLLAGRGGHSISTNDDQSNPYSSILRSDGCAHPPDWCNDDGELEIRESAGGQPQTRLASASGGAPVSEETGPYSQVAGKWVMNWTKSTRARVLHEVEPAASLAPDAASADDVALWEYAVSHGQLAQIDAILRRNTPDPNNNARVQAPVRSTRFVQWHIDTVHGQTNTSITSAATSTLDTSAVNNAADAAAIVTSLANTHRVFGNSETNGLTEAHHKAIADTCVKYDLASVLLHFVEIGGADTVAELQSATNDVDYPRWVHALTQCVGADNGGLPSAVALAQLRMPSDASSSGECDNLSPSPLLSLADILYSGVPLQDAVMNGVDLGGAFTLTATAVRGLLATVPMLASHVESLLVQCEEGQGQAAPAASSRLTVYDLLRKASFQNVVNLFSFQETSVGGGNSTSPMPHFSGPMSQRIAAVETLDYKYYLQQGRPLHAHDVYKKCVTTGTSVATPEGICAAVRELAITNFYNEGVTCACLMFLGLVHDDSDASLLRDDLAVAQRIFRHESRQFKARASAHIAADSPGLAASVLRIAQDPNFASDEVRNIVQRLDAATFWHSKIGVNKCKPTPESGQLWELVTRYCRRFGVSPSTTFLRACAEANDWVLFLGVAQSDRFPLAVVQEVAKSHFGSESLKAHIDLVLKSMLLENSDDGGGKLLWLSQDGSTYAHDENMGGSFDLFDLIFKCEASDDPFAAYLSTAAEYRLPQLAVLGACVGQNKLAVVCCWLLASISDSARSELAGKVKPESVTAYSRADFVTIVAQVARTDGMHLLVEGLSVVMGPDDISTPLKWVAAFHARFKAYDFTAALNQLHEYKMGAEKLSIRSGRDEQLNSVALVHETADAVIQGLLDSCDNRHDSEHLLRLLSMANYSQRYVHLHQTYVIMNSVGINFGEYETPEACVAALLDRGLFNEARSYAQAHQLSEDDVTLKEVESKLHEYENSRLWSLEKTRLDVWRQFQATFVDRRCAPDVAGTFFLERVRNDRGGGDAPDNVLFTAPETVLLLMTAQSWLSGSVTGSEPCRDEAELETLETQVWRLKIEIEVEFNQSVPTDLVPRAASSSVTTSVRAGDDTFARVGALQPHWIRGWGTKEATLMDSWSPPNPTVVGQSVIPLVSTPEERQALDTLIGALLADGDLAAASKLAARFQYQSQDLLLATIAFQLATESMSPKEAGARLVDIVAEDFGQLDTQQALRTLSQYCGPGEDCCRRLATNYTVARSLGVSYKSMLAQEAFKVLNSIVKRGPESFDLAQQFISWNKLAKSEVSQLLGHQYVQQLADSDIDNQDSDHTPPTPNATDWTTWGTDEFGQFANLCDPGVLGDYLLGTVYSDEPVKVDDALTTNDVKLNPGAEVTLLCRAHYCFVLACNTDAIDLVLAAARDLTARFVVKRHFRPLIRLLTSVRRYREMEYIFDALVNNDRFELLLAKDKMAGDAAGVAELKAALRDYLLRRHPKDTEKLQMVSLHFTMYREIGENRLTGAQQQIRALGKHAPGSAKVKDLLFIIQMLSEAAQNLMTEECQRKARRCLTLARLVGLQVQMVDVALLNLDRTDVARFLIEHSSFKESLVVAQAYSQSTTSDWVSPIYTQVVQRGNPEYFDDVRAAIRVTPAMYKEFAAIFLRDPARNDCAANFQALLSECPDTFVQHTLAKEVGLAAFAKNMELEHEALVRA